MRLVAFCEAPADFVIATVLVDRVLREQVEWIGDVLDASPDGVREWRGDGEGRPFFDLHKLARYTRARGIRVPHGHFDGTAGRADAVMARTAFALVRAMAKAEAIDGVVLVRDMDGKAADRRTGLGQARAEAQTWEAFRVVLGCPDIMREAWVLAGFEAESDEERKKMTQLRQELGFSPIERAHELDSNDEQAKRNPKRVLRVLTADDREREAKSWTDTSLEVLRSRGEGCGLREFLDEVAERFVPLLQRQV